MQGTPKTSVYLLMVTNPAQVGTSEPLKHFAQVIKLFVERPSNNDNIVQARHAGFASKDMQDGLHQPLKRCRTVAEEEGHDCELPQSLTDGERCLSLS
jgi:hypothetical protein